jgi:hypothetical protein
MQRLQRANEEGAAAVDSVRTANCWLLRSGWGGQAASGNGKRERPAASSRTNADEILEAHEEAKVQGQASRVFGHWPGLSEIPDARESVWGV